MSETRDHDDAISALVEDGEVHLQAADFGGARRLFEEAVAQAELTHGPHARQLIVPLMGLARASGEDHASDSEPMDRELAVQERALAIAEAALTADDPLLAEVLHAHGVSVWASGHPARAVDLLVRALGVVRRAGGDAHGYLGPLVGALLDAQRATDALPHARELLRLEETSSPADLTTLFVVGQCFRDAGATEEARVVLERFLAAPGSDGDPTIHNDVQTWLSTVRPAESREV
ncbi:MAG TPA: tetratricopeptide repeat protein [Labilithrix sp.]|nr:tetratricopeptide repeat protein [Labilithrix sp.]